MELVYLWVEDYKNIHKQGFNFSPQFECKFHDVYGDDGKLKDNCELEIIEKKEDEYIKDFFGDNINVTAIVGKNGSGKSTLIELIDDLSYEQPLINPYPISSLDFIQITIYYDDAKNKFYVYQKNLNPKIHNQSSIEIEEKTTAPSIQKISIASTPAHSQKEYLLLLDFLIKNDISFPFDIPEIIRFGIHDDYFDLIALVENDSFNIHDHYSPFEEDHNKRFKIFHILLLLAYLKNFSIDFDIKASEDYDDTISALEYEIDEPIKNKIQAFITTIENNLESFSKNPNHYINKNNIQNDFFQTYIDIIKRKNGEEILDFKGKNVFIFDLYPQMSDGQYQLTYLYNMIYSQINQENILLLIDEGENYLHPNWQKKYLSYIVQFLKYNFPSKKIHIILTSHSPFLLSDIPKQNIIFLDKDENGNCIVVDGLKEKKQTFGANIHTLLSDSFFMEDGLMGEFAKGKIDEVIRLLNKDILDDKELKYCEQIISIVGEPIVKNQLQRMLDSKRLKKVDEIDKIHEEIELLKHRIEILRKD